MATRPIPEGYHTVTPYLIVFDAAALIEFLQQAFGAEVRHRSATPDGTVVHAEVKIGDSHLMIGGASDQHPAVPAVLYLYLPDCDAAYQRALAAGATSVSEPADQFYGDRHGGVKDRHGNQWWIATHVEDVPPEEMKRREQEHLAKRQG
jgi:uncharacterized glyoxalase superfamily protein PhnB